MNLPGGQKITAPQGIPTGGLGKLGSAATNVFTLFLILAVVLCLIYIVLGGIQWSASGGDKNKMGAARAKITWAVVGLVICFLSLFLISVVGTFFGVNLLSIPTK